MFGGSTTAGCFQGPSGSSSSPFGGTNSSSFTFGSNSPVFAFGSEFGVSSGPIGSSPVFGTSNPSSVFGGTSNAAFGTNSSIFGSESPFTNGALPVCGFGVSSGPIGSSSVFGSSNPSSREVSVFGGTSNAAFNTNSSTFSSESPFTNGAIPAFGLGSSSLFGQNSPLGGTSSGAIGQNSSFGSIFTFGSSSNADYTSSADVEGKLQSISVMPANKDKSHEELRWEDYQAGDKGLGSSSLFGQNSPLGGTSSGAIGQNSSFGSIFTFGSSSNADYTSSADVEGKLQSISVMPANKDKSHEELRWEDYQAGDKGLGSSSLFGQNSPLGGTSSGAIGQNSSFGSKFTFGSSSNADYTSSADVEGKLQSISVMPANKDKSHEELRWEDYQAGDKGSSYHEAQSPTPMDIDGSPELSNSFFTSTCTNPSLFINPSVSFPPQSSFNPFAQVNSSNPFAPNSTPNPFAPKSTSNPFAPPKSTSNPFAPKSTSNPFAPESSQNQNPFPPRISQNQNPFGPRIPENRNPFGPRIHENPFAPEGSQNQYPFGPRITRNQNPFGPRIPENRNPFGPRIHENPFAPEGSQNQNPVPPRTSRNQNPFHLTSSPESSSRSPILMFLSTLTGRPHNSSDRHRELRLNVDNMSYEELRELCDKIGYAKSGLKEDDMDGCLRKTKLSDNWSLQLLKKKETKCCICLEEYILGDEVGKLGCGHFYHTPCIKRWLAKKKVCPICKTAVGRATK